MSRDDLLADLQGEVSARPAAPPTPPPAAAPVEPGPGTPALDISWTPLRWSLPALRPASRGTGISLRLGPVRVSLSVR